METNKMIEEWKDFCLQKEDYESCYFQTLFHADPLLTKQQLKIIYQYFPSQDLLLQKMIDIFDVLFKENKNNELTNRELKNLVTKDIEEKLRICYSFYEDTDELPSQEIISFPISITEDLTYFRKIKNDGNNLNNILLDYLGDTLDELLEIESKKVWALLDAFYGLTHNFTLQWYAATPLYSVQVNFHWYYIIWKAGADYIITNNQILIYHKKTNDSFKA